MKSNKKIVNVLLKKESKKNHKFIEVEHSCDSKKTEYTLKQQCKRGSFKQTCKRCPLDVTAACWRSKQSEAKQSTEN